MATAPTPIPAGPALPDSSAAEEVFDVIYETFEAWERDVLVPGANALAANVYANAQIVETKAGDAEASAAAAAEDAALAQSAAGAAGAIAWVSGTTYVAGDVRYSPLNFQNYRRKTDGAGTIDPSLDTANWAILGAAYPFTNSVLMAQTHAIALYF